MTFPVRFRLLILFLSVTLSPTSASAQNNAAAPSFQTYEAGFDATDAIPDGWKTEGNIRLSDHRPYQGKRSLELQRAQDKLDTKTAVHSPAFNVAPGPAEFIGAFRANLNSPDNSFKGEAVLEFLDAEGKVVDTERLIALHGQTGWRPVRKVVEVPKKAKQARLSAKLTKVSGSFWIDNVSFAPLLVDPATLSIVERIELKTETLGNLLLPGTKPVFLATVKTDKPLPESNRKLTGVVTDYWGAEQAAAVTAQLADKGKKDDWHVYEATLDFSQAEYDPYKYYGVRVSLTEPNGMLARETSSFAILPESPNLKYPYDKVPFNIRNWDNRIPAYFELSSRLGIRRAGIWGWWKFEPPYEGKAPGIDIARKLGQGPVVRIPTIAIEHRRKNFEKYTDEVLRKGYQAFYKKFHDEKLPMVITLGNEPRTTGPTIPVNVHTYQVAYEEIKKVNPETFVVGTSVGPVEEYFKLGFQNYSDAVDFHSYGDHKGIKKTFEKYAELFKKYGGEQPVWSTELGLNSQGLARRVVAGELIKKTAYFFRYGGQNMCWATLCFPDRRGKLRGGADDSHNVFDGLYGNYSPRLDALAYYNVVNGVGIKPFREHKDYEDGVQAFLFATEDGDSFVILWKEQGRKDIRLPLPGVEEVRVTSIDGVSTTHQPGGKGIGLSVTPDPVLLYFKGGNGKLAPRLEEPAIRIVEIPKSIVRGQKAVVLLAHGSAKLSELKAHLPPDWEGGWGPVEESGVGRFNLQAPDATEASFAAVPFTTADSRHDLLIPVEGQFGIQVAPVPGKTGEGAVDLVIRNNNDQAEKVDWKLTLKNEIAVDAGEYNLERAQSPSAYFAEATSGQTEVPGNSETSVRVPLASVDPLSVYEVAAEVTDPSGRTVRQTRYVGGFVGVPKAKDKVALDGKLDEGDWARATVIDISDERQFRHFRKTSNWSGPEDLSAKMRFLWDAENLYMAVEVTDDVFRNPSTAGQIWRGDSIQFLVDPKRGQKEKPGKYDYAFGVGKDGPAASAYLSADGRAPTGPAPEIKFATTKGEKGNMVYEAAIPWSRLVPFEPGVGANLGMAVILNEDDEPTRDAVMAWFGDLHTKEVETVGDLILTE